MLKSCLINRRTMLRGARRGHRLAPAFRDHGLGQDPPKGGSARSPMRVGFFYIPNGVTIRTPGSTGKLPA